MLLFSLLVGYALSEAPAPPMTADMIIIGAGWSGMGAADHLQRSKFTSFLILESTNRTGGRSTNLKFGDPAVGEFMFEEGSNWICGGPHGRDPSHGTMNPIMAEAWKVGLKLCHIEGGTQNMSNYIRIFDHTGKNVDPDGSLRKTMNRALDCINKTASHAHKDMTVRAALDQCNWKPNTEAEIVVDWAATVDDPGIFAKDQSLLNTVPDESYMWWGPDDEFVIDQSPRGYAHLIDTMLDAVPSTDPRIQYNTEVVKIDYTCEDPEKNCVVVTAKDGRVFQTKTVISTLPLGSMQRNHMSIFTPPLPQRQAEALDHDGAIMANLSKVFMQFKTPFWDPSVQRWLAGSDKLGEFVEWHNMNHPDHVPGSHVIWCWLGEPQSSYYEGQPDSVLKTAIMARLRELYPGKQIEEPSAFHLTRHGINPNRYGSYSAFKMGWTDADFTHMIKPLRSGGKDRVYFGGEHTCDDMNGFTHGALIRGQELAKDFLGEKYKSMCDW